MGNIIALKWGGKLIYLDNAATTFPKPKSVVDSVHSAITCYGGNPGRGGHSYAMLASERIYDIRKKVGFFFGAQPQNVVFSSNCTHALNMAIKGVLKAGDHAILSCLEHNSVVRPLFDMKKSGMITYDIATVYDNDNDTVNSFKQLIRNNTKLIVCTHASNVSGRVMPIKKLGELCCANGIIFLVDGAQTAGVLPINMNEMQIDILCTAGHKGLYGITGTGLMVLNDSINSSEIATILQGGTGSLSIELEQPEFLPDRFEAGTLNTAGIFSIGAGIDFINKTGLDKIYNHEFMLCKKVYEQLYKNKNISLALNSYKIYNTVPIVSFNIGGINSDKVVGELNSRGFALRGGLHCSPLAHKFYGTIDSGMVRFAPSFFTTEQACDEFVKVIYSISKKSQI